MSHRTNRLPTDKVVVALEAGYREAYLAFFQTADSGKQDCEG